MKHRPPFNAKFQDPCLGLMCDGDRSHRRTLFNCARIEKKELKKPIRKNSSWNVTSRANLSHFFWKLSTLILNTRSLPNHSDKYCTLHCTCVSICVCVFALDVEISATLQNKSFVSIDDNLRRIVWGLFAKMINVWQMRAHANIKQSICTRRKKKKWVNPQEHTSFMPRVLRCFNEYLFWNPTAVSP